MLGVRVPKATAWHACWERIALFVGFKVCTVDSHRQCLNAQCLRHHYTQQPIKAAMLLQRAGPHLFLVTISDSDRDKMHQVANTQPHIAIDSLLFPNKQAFILRSACP